MSNDQWAARKGYERHLAGSDANGYLFQNKTPNAKQLDSLRADAYAMITRRMASKTATDAPFLLSLEYRLVEILRQYEVAIKRGELELVVSTVNQLLTLIPSEVATDVSLGAEGARIQRGTTSG